MTPITAATVLLVLGGVGGIAWMLWPSLRHRAEERETSTSEPSDAPDVATRLEVLIQRGSDDSDALEPWTQRQPMLPDEPRRIPFDFTPAEKLPVIVDGEDVWLLPIASALLDVPAEAPEVLCGRRQGRAFHAVRIEPGLYLDLIELVRLLPVIGVELDGRGVASRDIAIYDDLDAIDASDESLSAVAPWLAGAQGPRVLPEGDGARSWSFTLGEASIDVTAWLPGVAAGVRSERLGWAGVITWEGAVSLVDAGATPLSVLEHLVDDAPAIRSASLAAWRWSRLELAELAAVGHYLDEQGVAILPLLRDAFADGTYPMPDLHDEAQSLTAAAVLNWVAVIHRRSGFPKRALGLLDAALTTCAPDDDDNRADIHYNRGYCRLQALMADAPLPTGTGDLHAAVFAEPPSPQALEPVRADFEVASRLNPADAHAWSQLAIVHQLAGEVAEAKEAWLQSATRARDPEVQRQLLANADALEEGA